MLNREQMYQIIDFAVAEAEGYDIRVMVVSSEEGLTRFANSEIHQNVFEDVTSVELTVFEGKKRSAIETNLYSEDGLRDAVKEAINNLQFLPEGELELPLVDAPLAIESDSFNSALAQRFGTMERATYVQEGLKIMDYGFKAYGALAHKEQVVALGNSKGIKRYGRTNGVEFSVLISEENGGSSYTELSSSNPAELDIIGAFKTVYERAKMNKNPMELEPGAYTVILEPLAVCEILSYLSYIGFSGKSVHDRYSFLTGKLGEKIFDEKITIMDDFTNENTSYLPFDFEGFPRKVVTLVQNGVAKELVYDQMSAIKDGVKSTGHSVNMPQNGGMPLNIVFSSGDQSLQEMIESTENGLLITRFHYMNVVNPRQAILTALTRDGVFKIENGKLVGAVKNMRFTESMVECLKDVPAISKEQQSVKSFASNSYVPSIKLNNFHFTGKTNA